MAAYPEVQRKAQALLDAVLGNDRLPNFSDRPNLPYIDAIVYELLRWRPPAPMGLPHALTQDDYYNGYFIPKGALFTVHRKSCILMALIRHHCDVECSVSSHFNGEPALSLMHRYLQCHE